jgi:hypothetical protein
MVRKAQFPASPARRKIQRDLLDPIARGGRDRRAAGPGRRGSLRVRPLPARGRKLPRRRPHDRRPQLPPDGRPSRAPRRGGLDGIPDQPPDGDPPRRSAARRGRSRRVRRVAVRGRSRAARADLPLGALRPAASRSGGDREPGLARPQPRAARATRTRRREHAAQLPAVFRLRGLGAGPARARDGARGLARRGCGCRHGVR